jgi:type I restriction enzyme R subunit
MSKQDRNRLPASAARDLRQRQTQAEQCLWACLRDRRLAGLKFRRQQRIANTPYVVDFFCCAGKLIIEVDGPIHAEQVGADLARQHEIEALGYRVLRFTNDQVLDNINNVLLAIGAVLDTKHS